MVARSDDEGEIEPLTRGNSPETLNHESGRQCPSSRAGPAKPRCSAANHKGVRGDLRIMDRSIPSHQIGLTRIPAAYPAGSSSRISAVHR